MTAGRTSVTRKQKREAKDEQAEKRDAPGYLVWGCVVGTAFRAADIHSIEGRRRRVVRKELSSRFEVIIRNLDVNAANGIGVEPVHR